MFTLFQVDDGEIVLRSNDSGDIARVFRLVGYDLPVPKAIRITDIYVTIHKQDLTEENSHAKFNYDRDDSDLGPGSEPELPF